MDEPLGNLELLRSEDLRPIDTLVIAGAVAAARAGLPVSITAVAAALDCPASILRCLYRIEPILPPPAPPAVEE